MSFKSLHTIKDQKENLPRAQIHTLQSFRNASACFMENAGNVNNDYSCTARVCPSSHSCSFILLLFPAARCDAWTSKVTPPNLQILPALRHVSQPGHHAQVTMLRVTSTEMSTALTTANRPRTSDEFGILALFYMSISSSPHSQVIYNMQIANYFYHLHEKCCLHLDSTRLCKAVKVGIQSSIFTIAFACFYF